MISYRSILDNDCIFSKDGLKWIELNKSIDLLRTKYANAVDDFESIDGFAFPSNEYVTQFKNLSRKTRLIQISNVNQPEWIITNHQKFEYVPNKYLTAKKRYLLHEPVILISLTGGADLSNDITSYFDNTFSAFLNQRVSALKMKVYDKHCFFYFYALTKTTYFKEQWLGKGGVQKNTVASDRAKVYLPKVKSTETIEFVSVLTQAIINKERLIKERHELILQTIEAELLNNQKPNTFTFELPRIQELETVGRLDTGLYSKTFKYYNYLVKNYIFGSKNIIEQGFSWSRGTSLENNFIGTRVDSETYKKGFYELVLPTNISQYGCLTKTSYIGTPAKLKTLQQGDIVFGGEATFRSYVIIEEARLQATNYHGIRLINQNKNLKQSIFVRCFLDFWRVKGHLKSISVGGQGGHCSPSYFHLIEIPNFPEDKQVAVAMLYHNPTMPYLTHTFTLATFLEQDAQYNTTAGIYELDKTAKYLKTLLNQAIDNIVNDKPVPIAF
jgi:hypothetical protein